MFANLPTLRGVTILAFAQTEIQSTGPCGIILAEKPDGEMVTAWYRLGDSEWCHGHYFFPHRMTSPEAKQAEITKAYGDFLERVRSWKGPRKPQIAEDVIKLAKVVKENTEDDEPDTDIQPEDARPLALCILELAGVK